MNQLPENSLRIYDVTFSNIIFNRIKLILELCLGYNVYNGYCVLKFFQLFLKTKAGLT